MNGAIARITPSTSQTHHSQLESALGWVKRGEYHVRLTQWEVDWDEKPELFVRLDQLTSLAENHI
jgi:hypothetical protein